MIELRKMRSWDHYLDELFFSHLGLRIEEFEINAVESGMMNYVFRIRTDKGDFFIKQALSKARADVLGAALQTISTQRLAYEKKCISEISAFLPDGILIPAIHYYDPENHILLLGDVAGEEGKLLETILLEGQFNVSAASDVGRFLGVVHRNSWGVRRSIRGDRGNDRKNWERFLNMRTMGFPTDRVSPEIYDKLNDLYTLSLRHHSHDVLICMDCCPKNVVVRRDRKIGVFDFELASWFGDPAYDLGFFIGHYLLHAIRLNLPVTSLQAIADSVQAYRHEVEGMHFRIGMMARVLKFAAATIIYRIIGASRLPYIKPDSVPKLMHKAGALLCHDFEGDLDDAASLITEVLA